MSYIDWKKEYELGYEKIDVQHKWLVVYVNQLHDWITKDDDILKMEIQEIIGKLAHYAVYHFETEEILQIQHGYTGFAAHKNEHEEFKAQVAGYAKRFAANELKPMEIAEFLKAWILNHIAHSDMAMLPFLKEKGLI